MQDLAHLLALASSKDLQRRRSNSSRGKMQVFHTDPCLADSPF